MKNLTNGWNDDIFPMINVDYELEFLETQLKQ